jgi:uncharacterized protein YprB with RNaseH-like and TPR domain
MPRKVNDTARVLLFDLECSNLKADFGRILCFGWKWLGEGKAQVRDITQFPKRFAKDCTDDRDLVIFAREVLLQADVIVTWFGTYFDVPYLQTRLLAHGLDPVPPIAHDDGWKIARYALKLHSNRLASVSQFLGIEEKTPILPEHWTRATAGHRPSIRYVVKHCAQDVEVLEQAYERLRPYCKQPVNINLTRDRGYLAQCKDSCVALCPRCGSDKMTKRGYGLARTSLRQRYQCQKCGGWSAGKSSPLVVAR